MEAITDKEWSDYIEAMEAYYDLQIELAPKEMAELQERLKNLERVTKGGKGFKCEKCGKHRVFQYHNISWGEIGEEQYPFLYICAECGDSFEEEDIRELKKEGLWGD